jgi:hypothetical protein
VEISLWYSRRSRGGDITISFSTVKTGSHGGITTTSGVADMPLHNSITLSHGLMTVILGAKEMAPHKKIEATEPLHPVLRRGLCIIQED